MQVTNGDVILHVESAGDESAPPLLLLHGITGSVRSWGWFVPQLAEQYHVLALDFRGHGGSARTPDAYQPADYLSDAIATLEQLVSQPAIVIGHSLGGVTTASLAQRRPDLARAAVLEDPPLGPMSADDEELRRSSIFDVFRVMRESIPAAQAAGLPATALAEIMAASPFAAGGTMGDHVRPDSIQGMAEGLLEFDVSALDPVLDGTVRSAFDPTSPIPVPTLLLAADPSMPDVVAAPAHVAVVVENSPLVEAHVVDGAGHLIHDMIGTREEFVRQVEKFLARV